MAKQSIFRVGDRVAFAREFLRNTGQFTGRVPFLRGTITGTQVFGDNLLCEIAWHDGTTGRVIAPNLVRADRIHLEPQ